MDVTAKWIVGHPQDVEDFQIASSEQTANDSYSSKGTIISIVRESGINNDWRPCRKISPAQQSLVLDTESLSYSSAYHPTYMVEDNGKISVFPVPGATTNAFKVYYINNDPKNNTDNATLVHSMSDIRFFPTDKVHLVVLYAAVKSINNSMAGIIADLGTFSPSTVIADTLTAPSFTYTAAVDDTGIDMTIGALPDLESLGSAPGYDSPTTTISGITWATEYPSQANAITTALGKMFFSVESAEGEIEDSAKMTANIALGLAEVAESATDTDTTTGEIKTAADGLAMALSKFQADNADPSLFGDESEYTTGVGLTKVKNALDVARTIVADGVNSPTGNAAGDAASYLYTAEDTELMNGALAIASSEIQRANAHIAEWNATVQALIAEANGFANEMQARGAWTSAKAQVWNGYFASASAYAQAAQTYLASAQGYSNEVQTRLSTTGAKVSEYQVKVQDALNEFNEANVKYQAEIQEHMQESQNEVARLTTIYSKNTDVNVQNAVNSYRLYVDEYTANLGKYQAEVQAYSAEVNTEVQEQATKVQTESAKYQWLQDRGAALQAEYIAAFGAPQAQPQGGGR